MGDPPRCRDGGQGGSMREATGGPDLPDKRQVVGRAWHADAADAVLRRQRRRWHERLAFGLAGLGLSTNSLASARYFE